jgi:hypothetical protein
MNMNPATVASARTARLVREAATPVYSTSTPAPKVREHIMAVEIDSLMGRSWSTMPESQVDDYIRCMTTGETAEYYEAGLSDIDHSAKCWCQ